MELKDDFYWNWTDSYFIRLVHISGVSSKSQNPKLKHGKIHPQNKVTRQVILAPKDMSSVSTQQIMSCFEKKMVEKKSH